MKQQQKAMKRSSKHWRRRRKSLSQKNQKQRALLMGYVKHPCCNLSRAVLSPTLKLSDLCENLHESNNYQHFNSLQYEWPQLSAFKHSSTVIMGPDIKIQKVEDVENGFYFDTRKHIHVIMRNRIGAH